MFSAPPETGPSVNYAAGASYDLAKHGGHEAKALHQAGIYPNTDRPGLAGSYRARRTRRTTSCSFETEYPPSRAGVSGGLIVLPIPDVSVLLSAVRVLPHRAFKTDPVRACPPSLASVPLL